MHIVLTQPVADELRLKYTVLELDSMPHPELGIVPAFCVIPVEQIAMEMASLGQNIELHEQLIESMKADNTVKAVELCNALRGKFGGELDSFYDIVIERVNKTNTTALGVR